jgi:hypothetical protein
MLNQTGKDISNKEIMLIELFLHLRIINLNNSHGEVIVSNKTEEEEEQSSPLERADSDVLFFVSLLTNILIK